VKISKLKWQLFSDSHKNASLQLLPPSIKHLCRFSTCSQCNYELCNALLLQHTGWGTSAGQTPKACDL